jgi:DNA-binding MarR family transcriptional regulator
MTPGASSLRQPQHPDELLNYRLRRLYALSGAPVLRLLEGGYGIARREWRLISMLAANGASSPSTLAEQAQLDRPRTSRALSRLCRKGLVARVVQPGDRRRAQVALTPAGQAMVAELFPQVAALNRAVVAALDDAAVQALDAALTALTAQAERINAEQIQHLGADRRAGSARQPVMWDGGDFRAG